MQDMENKVYDEDEIDLRELIMLLWRNKVLIISFTLIVTILAGVISVFFISPVYETKLNLAINMPEKYSTKYGDYDLPITHNEQYIDLVTNRDVILSTIEDMGYDEENVTVEELRDRISINNKEKNASGNIFMLTVKSSTKEESYELAQALYKNYIRYVDLMINGRAIKNFMNYYQVQLESANKRLDRAHVLIEENEKLLAKTPQLINQNEVLSKYLEEVGEYIVIENIINPAYEKIESILVDYKEELILVEKEIEDYHRDIEELTSEEVRVKEGKECDLITAVDNHIFLTSQPTMPINKTSPSNSMNIIIGGVLGGMLSVMWVLVVAYWKKEI